MNTIKEELAATALSDATNDGEFVLDMALPYRVEAEVIGVSDILFHRWSVDGIEAKSKAAKGSKAKKSDDVESYVYRTEDGLLAIPAEYFRQAIIHAAKFKQDPRSPRKSAMDLFKAAVFPVVTMCSTGQKDWSYIDRRRVQIQRNGITRERPALRAGWHVQLDLEVVLPEYVSPELLNEVLQLAGRVIGIADFRPTYGRFQVTRFQSFQG